jgi:hypothetical protein
MDSAILSATHFSNGDGIIFFTDGFITKSAKTFAAVNLCFVVISVFLYFKAHLNIQGKTNRLFI